MLYFDNYLNVYFIFNAFTYGFCVEPSYSSSLNLPEEIPLGTLGVASADVWSGFEFKSTYEKNCINLDRTPLVYFNSLTLTKTLPQNKKRTQMYRKPSNSPPVNKWKKKKSKTKNSFLVLFSNTTNTCPGRIKTNNNVKYHIFMQKLEQ